MGTQTVIQADLPRLNDEFEAVMEPEQIYGVRWTVNDKCQEWLMRWKNHNDNKATWEAVEMM